MHPQIAILRHQLERATDRATALAAGVDDRGFHARSASGGWSAAECIAHLTLTTTAMLPRIDAALDAARSGLGDEQRYRRGFLGALLAWSMEPPARMRVRTLPAFVPASTGQKEAMLGEFQRTQRELAARIDRASGLNLTDLRIVSPFNARVKYNVYAAFSILLAHERRHLWQAERACADR